MEIGHGGRRLSLHHLDVLQAFARAAREVLRHGIVFQDAGHDLEIADPSREGIGQRLEHKYGQRLGVGDFSLYFAAFAGGFTVAGGRAALRRVRKHLGQQIEERRAADIVQRGSQHYRVDAFGLECLAQAFAQVFDRQRALLEKFLHQRVIALGDHFHQGFMRDLGRLGQVLGNLLDLGLAVAVRRVDVRFHGDQVDDPAERFLRADR